MFPIRQRRTDFAVRAWSYLRRDDEFHTLFFPKRSLVQLEMKIVLNEAKSVAGKI